MSYAYAIIGGFLAALVTQTWPWLPALAFVVAIVVCYGILFRKPKTPA